MANLRADFLRRISKNWPAVLAVLLSLGLVAAVVSWEKASQNKKGVPQAMNEVGGNTGEVGSGSKYQHPPVRGSDDFNGERSHFNFSPDHKYISFVQNVFDEYDEDWDRYWALVVFNPSNGEENTLFVDDTRLSSYQWLDNLTLRVFHSAGTGVRSYLDVSLDQDNPIFSKDFVGSGLWLPDEQYAQQSRNTQEAYRVYSSYKAK